MEVIMEGGSENIRRSYKEYPIVNTNKGKIYSRLSTIDRGFRPKYIASKHLYFKYLTLIYIRVAYLVSTLYITILQLLLSKGLAIY